MVSPLWRIVDATDAIDATDAAALPPTVAASTTNKTKQLLIFNPYLGLSKLICVCCPQFNRVQKVGLPKNTKTKKEQTVDYAYASCIVLNRVNGFVPAFAGQPAWEANQKRFTQIDSGSRGQCDIDTCVS